MRLLVLVMGFALLACPAVPPSAVDGGPPDLDAGITDAGANDAGAADAGVPLPPDGGVAPHGPLPAEVAIKHDVFATGRVCGDCHDAVATSTANKDEQGQPVGLYSLWSASVMANATRDPLFRAALANEQARAPAAADAIAEVCLTCHGGMGRAAQAHAGLPTTSDLLFATTNEGALARDGVSCTLCHQVEAATLGQEASFSGGYQLNTARWIYGPWAAPFATPMVNRSGFTPTQGTHLQSSAFCGTCHVLVTEALTTDGVGTGHRMGEQLTYLEWRQSDFSTEGGGATPTSCQQCHLPDTQADGGVLSTPLAHRPDGTDFTQLGPRGPFSRHTFAGGNTLLPRLLRDGRALLNPPATDAQLVVAEGLARDQLRRRAARLTLEPPTRAAGVVRFAVRVENLTGHKFPSGYPSRRAFLQVSVLDAAGAPLVEWGRTDGAGRLLGADGQPLPPERVGGPAWPHRQHASAADEAVVYESVMDDGHGGPSFELLGAEGFVKDDRLLPRGHHDTSTGPRSTAPVGVGGDADFGPGGDRVTFEVPVGHDAARVVVRLRYQVTSPRYLEELLARPTPAAAALRTLLRGDSLAPELVDEASAALP